VGSASPLRSVPIGKTNSKQTKGDVSIHLKAGKQAEFLGLLMPVIDAVRLESPFVNNCCIKIPKTQAAYDLGG
jgi:hypothetical protein